MSENPKNKIPESLSTEIIPPSPLEFSENDVLGMVVATGTTPTFYECHFRINPGRQVHPAQWILIIDPNAPHPTALLGRVVDTVEHNPHEDALSSNIRHVLPLKSSYAKEGHSTIIYRLAEAEVMEELFFDKDGQLLEVAHVQNPPAASAIVVAADGPLVSAALGLPQHPEDGLHVGAFADQKESCPFVLNKATIQRHFGIVGGIGSGKSYARGVIAEELHAWGVPQINIDINNEMVDAAKELGGISLVPGKDGFTLPLSSLTANEILDAIPTITPTSVMAELVKFAHEELLNESRRTGEHFGVQDLLDKIDQVAPRLEAKPNSILPAKARTQSSLQSVPFIGKPFKWETHLTPGAFINIECRLFGVGYLRLIVAAIARDLQRLAKSQKIPFVVFSIDEAHLVAPSDEDTMCLQVLRELARIGRHYRIGLILTSQSPQDLDKSILKRLLTRFLFAIEPDQLQSLKGVFSDASEQLIAQLPKMPQGTCIVTGAYETLRHATQVKVRRRRTTPGGSTPDVWSDFANRGWKGKKEISQ